MCDIGKKGTSIKCCGVKEKRPECFPIEIPDDDPYFKTDCLNFVRSAEAVRLDFSPAKLQKLLLVSNKPIDLLDQPLTFWFMLILCAFLCSFDTGPREQINQVTSYIDASAVYGSNKKAMDELRLFKNGLLKTSKFEMLPPQNNGACRLTHKNEFCMLAGDFRVNVVPNLSILHLLFVREHNRIAKKLGKLNPMWNDERIFQESRKIIAAYIQQISYQEYIAEILDQETLCRYKLRTTIKGFNHVYNDTINSSIRNVFAVAAFRFGHAQITSSVLYYKQNNDIESRILEDTFHNPHMVQDKHGRHIPDLGRWIVYDKSIKADRCMVSAVRDKLFIDKEKRSFDLAALNIQRGRDHGIPPYVKWRTWCGLSKVTSFDSGLYPLIDHDRKTILKLKKAYKSVRDIDLFAGGISEIHLPGADVGPTFACILGRQFQALKEGDRFWFEIENYKTGFTKG
ncbi:hypothetical protein KUTeg_008060 [Tegillarca granosa]|uniref:Peroxidase n=1 Tax=Tegillarca granosa TaxID=220873 RepID=A0ABQ9F835_TEGGR|nr:hypothetical protein KUTeg_008060 [Tegillarca granosa]